MKNIIATLRAQPGKGPALEKELRELVSATSREAGAMVYDLLSDDAQPDTFVVYERYRDPGAKADHLASEHLKKAMERAAPVLAGEPALMHLSTVAGIRHLQVPFEGRQVELVEMPVGPVRLVYVHTDRGILACGAIDPAALEKFGVPAARVRPTTGGSIGSFDDLLAGEVREANTAAQSLGLKPGMTGREALRKL